MFKSNATTGYFRCGLPYNRSGSGPRNLIIFQGLLFENKAMPGGRLVMRFLGYSFLEKDYTLYLVNRRPGLPSDYSMQDMADAYAVMIREEFGGPVDLIGVSTGGSIAQHFAAKYPELVGKLILHSSAYTLGEAGKEFQLRLGELAKQCQWRASFAAMADFLFHPTGVISRAAVGAGTFVLAQIPFVVPKDPSDLIVTIEAEDRHNFKERLSEITVPTLVIGGDKDPFFPEPLIRETAAGIPGAKLILYPGKGHTPTGKQFEKDVLAFLNPAAQ